MSGYQTIISSKGLQDMYLTNKPEHTHLKSSYNQYTNFSKFLMKVSPDNPNSETFTFGDTVHFDIEKPADLLLNVNLQLRVNGSKWVTASNIVPETMYALIDYIEITSNDKTLERLSGDGMYVLDQLYNPNFKYVAATAYANNNTTKSYLSDGTTGDNYILNLPLPFWFCNRPGFAIPLWAIQHENIRINVKFRNFLEIAIPSETQSDYTIHDVCLLNEYINVTEKEKLEFQEKPLEYIIEQVDCMPPEKINLERNGASSRQIIDVKLNDLVKELIWVFRPIDFSKPQNFFHFLQKGGGGSDTGSRYHTNNISISLNGNKICKKPTTFFTNVQRGENHNCSRPYTTDLENVDPVGDIYCYSFGLKADDIFPSGFLSMEKFNKVTLDLEINGNSKPRNLLLFIKKYNILRIKDGHVEVLSN